MGLNIDKMFLCTHDATAEPRLLIVGIPSGRRTIRKQKEVARVTSDTSSRASVSAADHAAAAGLPCEGASLHPINGCDI